MCRVVLPLLPPSLAAVPLACVCHDYGISCLFSVIIVNKNLEL